MDIIKTSMIGPGITLILLNNPGLTKYRLAKDLNLSTSTHLNNYITGATKTARIPVMAAMYSKYGVLVKAYEDTAEYKKLNQPQEIRI